MVLALILAALLILSWFGSFTRHLGFGRPVGRHYVRGLDEVVIEDNRAAHKIAVIEVTARGLVLKEIASDTTVEKVRAATGADLIVESVPAVF